MIIIKYVLTLFSFCIPVVRYPAWKRSRYLRIWIKNNNILFTSFFYQASFIFTPYINQRLIMNTIRDPFCVLMISVYSILLPNHCELSSVTVLRKNLWRYIKQLLSTKVQFSSTAVQCSNWTSSGRTDVVSEWRYVLPDACSRRLLSSVKVYLGHRKLHRRFHRPKLLPKGIEWSDKNPKIFLLLWCLHVNKIHFKILHIGWFLNILVLSNSTKTLNFCANTPNCSVLIIRKIKGSIV